jgi:hypothetical protein
MQKKEGQKMNLTNITTAYLYWRMTRERVEYAIKEAQRVENEKRAALVARWTDKNKLQK